MKDNKLMRRQTILLLLVFVMAFSGCSSVRELTLIPKENRPFVIVYQPSHQTDTGKDYNEALVCSAISEAAMASASPNVEVHKVWSYDVDSVHHARVGSNTKIDHTTAIENGRISGYAWEVQKANTIRPDLFIGVHNNGASKRNGCWGFVHEGDSLEQQNRVLARVIVKAICEASGLENLGDHGDSEPNRNDYRCVKTGKLCFYSIDENVNQAPYRVLLEIGDNAVSRAVLTDPVMQKKIGIAIQKAVESMIGDE